MNMTINLLDILSFLLLPGLVGSLIKHRSFWRTLAPSAPRSLRLALIISAVGATLSAILYGVSFSHRELNLIAAAVGCYGVSFYAITYLSNPLLRLRLKMPWRTSVRFYLLFFLAGFSAYKLGGVDKAYYYFIFCSGVGACLGSRNSLAQTLVMLFQLLATLVTLWLAPDELLWILLAVGNLANFALALPIGPLIVEEEYA